MTRTSVQKRLGKYPIIRRAEVFARWKHWGQKRASGGFHYQRHLKWVKHLLSNAGYGPRYQALGLLHDVLEDTDANFALVLKVFGLRMAFLVLAMTKSSTLKSISPKWGSMVFWIGVLVAMLSGIIAVRAADRAHNISLEGAHPYWSPQRHALYFRGSYNLLWICEHMCLGRKLRFVSAVLKENVEETEKYLEDTKGEFSWACA